MNQKNYSVHLGGVSLLDKYNLIMTSKYIGPPTPKTKLVEIPGRSGAIDMSEVLTGRVVYEQREIKIELCAQEKPVNFTVLRSKLQNEFHGKLMQIVFDDDAAYYWEGRIEVDFENKGALGTVKIKANVNPYKKWVHDTTEEWLWDPFDFEVGVINNLKDIPVDGSKSVVVVLPEDGCKDDCPIIQTTADMSVKYENKNISLKKGETTVYDFVFHPGENTLVFNGKGTVSIIYRGGSL